MGRTTRRTKSAVVGKTKQAPAKDSKKVKKAVATSSENKEEETAYESLKRK